MHNQRFPDPPVAQICRMLVAASDHRLRSALRALLEADGRFRVVAQARTVEETMLLDATWLPALILLDLLFPTATDGLDAVCLLAFQRKRPIVVLSAQTGPQHAALAAGAAGFVVQGEGTDVLLAVLAAAIAQPPPASS